APLTMDEAAGEHPPQATFAAAPEAGASDKRPDSDRAKIGPFAADPLPIVGCKRQDQLKIFAVAEGMLQWPPASLCGASDRIGVQRNEVGFDFRAHAAGGTEPVQIERKPVADVHRRVHFDQAAKVACQIEAWDRTQVSSQQVAAETAANHQGVAFLGA